jgi:hypothetical protein
MAPYDNENIYQKLSLQGVQPFFGWTTDVAISSFKVFMKKEPKKMRSSRGKTPLRMTPF